MGIKISKNNYFELNLFNYLKFRNSSILAQQYNLIHEAFYEASENFLFVVLKMACHDNEVIHIRVKIFRTHLVLYSIFARFLVSI